ncbi:MFS transporter [Candidatus Bathyarchaeota archaeon]|nr:MFS transporter [Candidatus Bathyarchaeota archaeon]
MGAGVFVPGVKLVSSWFNSEERGTALGLLNIGGSVGMIIAGWYVPLLCVGNGWRASLRIMGIFGVLSSICIFYLLRDRTIVSIKRIKLESLPLKK